MRDFHLHENNIFTIYENDRDKTPKEIVKKEQNNHPFGFLLIHPHI